MANPVLSAPHFHNEEAAFAYVEGNLWPEGPVCPHCGNCDEKAIGRLMGKSSRSDMGRKPNPKPDNAEQSKRFIKAAEEVGADDDKALERAFKKIVPKKDIKK